MKKNKKAELRHKRHKRIVLKMPADSARPRLIIRRSIKNIYAQVIDDTRNKVLFSLSTMDKEVKEKFPCAGNLKAAEFFGHFFALKAKEKGVAKIVFDRAGYLYHGRVKAFADALRKGGLEF